MMAFFLIIWMGRFPRELIESLLFKDSEKIIGIIAWFFLFGFVSSIFFTFYLLNIIRG